MHLWQQNSLTGNSGGERGKFEGRGGWRGQGQDCVSNVFNVDYYQISSGLLSRIGGGVLSEFLSLPFLFITNTPDGFIQRWPFKCKHMNHQSLNGMVSGLLFLNFCMSRLRYLLAYSCCSQHHRWSHSSLPMVRSGERVLWLRMRCRSWERHLSRMLLLISEQWASRQILRSTRRVIRYFALVRQGCYAFRLSAFLGLGSNKYFGFGVYNLGVVQVFWSSVVWRNCLTVFVWCVLLTNCRNLLRRYELNSDLSLASSQPSTF